MSKLVPIVESRFRRMFTDATSALLPAALLAGPELRPEKTGPSSAKVGR